MEVWIMTTQSMASMDEVDAVAYATSEAAIEDLCDVMFDGTDGFMMSSEYLDLMGKGRCIVDDQTIVTLKKMTVVA